MPPLLRELAADLGCDPGGLPPLGPSLTPDKELLIPMSHNRISVP